MNRAERRKQAKLDKKKNGKVPSTEKVALVWENDGRMIIAHYPNHSPDEGLCLELAMCLHHTLEHFGDISGVGGQAIVSLTVKNGLPSIKVDRDCDYIGRYNRFSGKMSAKACELALGTTLSCHWGNYLAKHNPKLAQKFFNHYHKLRETAFQSLSDVEQAEFWKFLD